MTRQVPVALACLLFAACGDGFPRAVDMTDSGTTGSDGSSPPDGGAADTGPLEADSDYVLARDGTGLAPSVGGMDACYGAEACDGAMCEGVRSCCVGSGACCDASGADPAPSLGVSASCSDFDTAEDCLVPGMSGFGDPLPYVFDGGLVPGGDAFGDSGLLADEPVDLTVHHAVIRATIRTPLACAAECIETVGLGVTAQSTVAGTVHPIAALLFSAARDRMTLMIGEAQVGVWNEIADMEEWTLELLPSGTVEVKRNGEAPMGFEAPPYEPSESARVVLYGHTVNPAASEPTRLENVSLDVSLCDVPDAWRDRGPLLVTLDGGGALSPDAGVRGPSLLRGSRTLLAWEQANQIWLAEDLGSGFVAQASSILGPDASAPWMDEGVGDPSIVERADGSGYAIFFTAHQSGGRPSIGRLDLDSDLEPLAESPVTRVATGEHVGADEILEPSVWMHSPETWIMVVRAPQNGVIHLRVLRSDDAGMSWVHHRTAALETLTARAGDRSISGFDSDDIGHPSLVAFNGAWQLYYTGRRGTRAGVGLLLSDDLVNWRFLDPGEAVLSPGKSADEQVGVLAQDVVVESFGLSMVYVADDGYRQRLYSTSRRATNGGMF